MFWRPKDLKNFVFERCDPMRGSSTGAGLVELVVVLLVRRVRFGSRMMGCPKSLQILSWIFEVWLEGVQEEWWCDGRCPSWSHCPIGMVTVGGVFLVAS